MNDNDSNSQTNNQMKPQNNYKSSFNQTSYKTIDGNDYSKTGGHEVTAPTIYQRNHCKVVLTGTTLLH